MVIIFLDIDGVLNQLQGNYYLDNKCIENLSKLYHKLDGKIVLTSSWRIGYTKLGKCTPQIEELKYKLSSYNMEIIGRTPKLGDRTEEISDYIVKHNIVNYIIIDDDIGEFGDTMLYNTFIVNGKAGLTYRDVKNILKNVNKLY